MIVGKIETEISLRWLFEIGSLFFEDVNSLVLARIFSPLGAQRGDLTRKRPRTSPDKHQSAAPEECGPDAPYS